MILEARIKNVYRDIKLMRKIYFDFRNITLQKKQFKQSFILYEFIKYLKRMYNNYKLITKIEFFKYTKKTYL